MLENVSCGYVTIRCELSSEKLDILQRNQLSFLFNPSMRTFCS